MIYTLTVSFGDVGKAFVVVVMVIQIAGSSGTYPIEILPQFNQNIYKYFPFPYAINAMRETIGGMYENDYWWYMSQLAVFAIAALDHWTVCEKTIYEDESLCGRAYGRYENDVRRRCNGNKL